MKTIVNIVSAQTLPNYLFVKEMYNEVNKIIWIATPKVDIEYECLIKSIPNINHEKIYIEKEYQENSNYIEKLLLNNITEEECFLINLTGGTKLISLSVYNFFKKQYEKQSKFYYISIDKKNTIINIDSQEEISIKYRVSIDEYFKLYNLRKKEETAEPYLSFNEAKYMYSLLDKNIYKKEEISTLREGYFKGKKKYKDDLKPTYINDLKDTTIKNFIIENKFPTKEKDKISKYDVKYIVGGWLEDLIYYITKENEKPNNILVGFHIYKGDNEQSSQELDVVYTKDNVLYIRECKTSFETEKIFNEIIYKAAAIKTLFGISMKSSIYCCREKLDEDEKNERKIEKMNETLQKMGITYFGKTDIDNELSKLN